MSHELAADQDAAAPGPSIDVNSDLTRRVIVHSASMPWSPSPWIPGINRKFLDRYGNGQFVPSTSLVSFASGVRDPYHAHPHGEEFYVLRGVFSDHTGDYLPGFYVRHPRRWCHAPYVDPRNDDAVVWVKVSQVIDDDEPIIVMDTCDLDLPGWVESPSATGRIRSLRLHESVHYPERVWIEIWEPGTSKVVTQAPGGEEIFVISGMLAEGGLLHPVQTWIRNPARLEGTRWARSTPEGCKLLVKSGHLTTIAQLYERAKDGAQFSSSVMQYAEHERIHGSPHAVDVRRRQREAAAARQKF